MVPQYKKRRGGIAEETRLRGVVWRETTEKFSVIGKRCRCSGHEGISKHVHIV